MPCATSADVTLRLAESKQAVGRTCAFDPPVLDEPMTSRIVRFMSCTEQLRLRGTATSAVTRASRTGSLNPMDPSAASGNGNQLTRMFETSSGIGVTGKLREERRYFASGKSLSEQRQTRTTLGRNRDAHRADFEFCFLGVRALFRRGQALSRLAWILA